jgi:prepilin-type N-terminal cleavage/methylation domain-containing protein
MQPYLSTDSKTLCVRRQRQGFTLVELLVVVGVMAIMMTIAVPAFNAIRGGTDFTSEVYDISGMLEQARSYAMANNTYVLAGIIEVSSTLSSSAASQPGVAAGAVGGRIAMAAIASTTGMRPYIISSNIKNTWQSGYGTGLNIAASANVAGGGFVPVTKLASFQNIHLVDLQYGASQPPGSGGMARPVVSQYYDIPNALCYSAAGFGWPLGTHIFNGTPTSQYIFNSPSNTTPKVIEFDPQGSARIITTQGPGGTPLLDAIPQYIEIGLQPSHGTVASGPPASQVNNPGQIAAIQIDGMTGAIRIYRP